MRPQAKNSCSSRSRRRTLESGFLFVRTIKQSPSVARRSLANRQQEQRISRAATIVAREKERKETNEQRGSSSSSRTGQLVSSSSNPSLVSLGFRSSLILAHTFAGDFSREKVKEREKERRGKWDTREKRREWVARLSSSRCLESLTDDCSAFLGSRIQKEREKERKKASEKEATAQQQQQQLSRNIFSLSSLVLTHTHTHLLSRARFVLLLPHSLAPLSLAHCLRQRVLSFLLKKEPETRETRAVALL